MKITTASTFEIAYRAALKRTRLTRKGTHWRATIHTPRVWVEGVSRIAARQRAAMHAAAAETRTH